MSWLGKLNEKACSCLEKVADFALIGAPAQHCCR